jgi:hypothetical protein
MPAADRRRRNPYPVRDQGPCRVSVARADLRFWRQRPESCLLSHDCALDLHGQHSAPAQVRATWCLIWRRDGPDSTPDRSLSAPASAQVNRLSDDFARALSPQKVGPISNPGRFIQLLKGSATRTLECGPAHSPDRRGGATLVGTCL